MRLMFNVMLALIMIANLAVGTPINDTDAQIARLCSEVAERDEKLQVTAIIPIQ